MSTVTIKVENGYECGRQSESTHELAAPDPDDLESWWEEVVIDYTGDGHSCGSSENALYEVAIIAATDRPELVGETWGWGG